MTEKQENLWLLLEGAYEELVHAVDVVPPGSLQEKTYGEWSIKDILGHVVSWGDEYRREIRAIREDPAPNYGYVIAREYLHYEWNKAAMEEKNDWPWRRIRADLDRDRAEMIAVIERAADRDFDACGTVPWKLESATARPRTLTRDNSCTVEELLTIHARHLKHHAEIIVKSRKGPKELFFEAVKRNQVIPIKKMLENDGDLVHARDDAGATALHHAVRSYHLEMTRILLEAGADLNARDGRTGATPADWAIEYLRKQGARLAREME